MAEIRADFIVIGAGVAGISAAAELSAHGHVVVLEREEQPAHHATGRSAAILIESYGSGPAQILTAASRPVFEALDLLSPRGVLHLAVKDAGGPVAPDVADHLLKPLSAAEVHQIVPLVPLERIEKGWLEPSAADIDVHGLLTHYLQRLRQAGGRLIIDAAVTGAHRVDGLWRLTVGSEEVVAPIVVNAAGAWARQVGQWHGARDIAVRPLRRTVALTGTPNGLDCRLWPLVVTLTDDLYFKPESGGLMVCPADETPSPPCDASADELDLAITMDRFEQLTGAHAPQLRARWAGLRSFAFDRAPVIGFDEIAQGFFWLAGQGGFGVQTAPAASALAAAMITASDGGAAYARSIGLDIESVSARRSGLEREVEAAALSAALDV